MMASELWGEDHASFCELIIKYTELHSSGDPPADETEFSFLDALEPVSTKIIHGQNDPHLDFVVKLSLDTHL